MGIGLVTEYYTSHSYQPVREMSDAYRRSASTGLILGYALGFKSTVIPLFLIASTVVIAMHLAGPFGIAMAGIGMLGTLTVALTIDAYGPISDNAGGIAEMWPLGREQAGLSAGGTGFRQRFQVGVRPVSDQCQTSVKYRIYGDPCHSVSIVRGRNHVILCPVRSAESCRMHSHVGCTVMSDAQKCHFGYALVLTEIHESNLKVVRCG